MLEKPHWDGKKIHAYSEIHKNFAVVGEKRKKYVPVGTVFSRLKLKIRPFEVRNSGRSKLEIRDTRSHIRSHIHKPRKSKPVGKNENLASRESITLPGNTLLTVLKFISKCNRIHVSLRLQHLTFHAVFHKDWEKRNVATHIFLVQIAFVHVRAH